MMKLLLVTLMAFSAGAGAHAAGLTFPDRNRAAVVDAAHVLPANVAASLNQRIVAWDKATGHQFVVATVPSLQGQDIATYGYQLGRAWGLGRKGINDGAILLLAPVEHRVRIEVGRGLEGDLTDAETSVILHETVVPKLKAGDITGAANAGADAIMADVPAGAGDMANAPVSSFMTGTELAGWLFCTFIAAGLTTWAIIMFRRRRREVRRKLAAVADRPRSSDAATRAEGYDIGPRFSGGYQPRYGGGAGIPPTGGSGASYEPRRSTTVVAPVIINNSPSYDTSPSWGSSSSDSGSSSSSDSGSSSSGFDSGGGDFGGGGSDSSW